MAGRDEQADALAAALAQIANLRTGLESRTVIGQATGILMERYQLDAERAFGALVRRANETTLKVRVVAERLVETGELP